MSIGLNQSSITIVGCGPGSRDYVTPAAQKAVLNADVAVGARRLLELFPEFNGERFEVSGRIGEAIDAVDQAFPKKRVAVLVSGDPGIFSLARLVIKRFGHESCRLVPGISSVQTAFSRIGLDWSDSRIISAHKELPSMTEADILNSDKIAVLGGSADFAQWLKDILSPDETKEYRIIVCCDLTLENESVEEILHSELTDKNIPPRSVVLLIRGELLE